MAESQRLAVIAEGYRQTRARSVRKPEAHKGKEEGLRGAAAFERLLLFSSNSTGLHYCAQHAGDDQAELLKPPVTIKRQAANARATRATKSTEMVRY